jgi:H+/gluconate symporter-like permease
MGALVGGFHLAQAPDDYLRQVMGEFKKLNLEHVLPMRCSGVALLAWRRGSGSVACLGAATAAAPIVSATDTRPHGLPPCRGARLRV